MFVRPKKNQLAKYLMPSKEVLRIPLTYSSEIKKLAKPNATADIVNELEKIAEKNRKHGSLNPKAQF